MRGLKKILPLLVDRLADWPIPPACRSTIEWILHLGSLLEPLKAIGMKNQTELVGAYAKIKSDKILTDFQKNAALATVLAGSPHFRRLANTVCRGVFASNMVEDLISDTCWKVMTLVKFPVRNGNQIVNYLKRSLRNNVFRLLAKEATEKRKLKEYYHRSPDRKIAPFLPVRSIYKGIGIPEIRTGIRIVGRENFENGKILNLSLLGASCCDIGKAFGFTPNQARYKVAQAKLHLKKVLENLV